MNFYQQQLSEITTIQERAIKLKLSDADCIRIMNKVGMAGLTLEELLQNFIGDLVDGTYSNGSDERMYAEQWFERCGFSQMSDKTFVRYLLEYGKLDSLLQSIDTLVEYAEEKKSLEAELQDKSYPWNDIFITSKDHPQGAKCYNAKEEWQEEQKRMLEDVEQEILFVQDEINEVWDDFLNWTDKKICDQEAEIKAVQEWQKNKEQLLK